MFTGLVQDTGVVCRIEKNADGAHVVIETNLELKDIPIGASICCSGVCLTIVENHGHSFHADVSGETLSKTAIGSWEEGTKVNLEPSLHMGDEIGGHFVFGHVDGTATIDKIEKDGESYRITLKAPEEVMMYIAPKGSVALDGVSLTVNEVKDALFEVNIIPHTWEKTTLGLKKPGDACHIEADMLARYVARMMGRAA